MRDAAAGHVVTVEPAIVPTIYVTDIIHIENVDGMVRMTFCEEREVSGSTAREQIINARLAMSVCRFNIMFAKVAAFADPCWSNVMGHG